MDAVPANPNTGGDKTNESTNGHTSNKSTASPELQDGLHAAAGVDPPDEVVVAHVEGAVRARGEAHHVQQGQRGRRAWTQGVRTGTELFLQSWY